MNYESIKEKALSADIVTFDVFDTLITRQVLHTQDVFLLVDILARKELNINFDFCKERKSAEDSFRNTNKKYTYNLNDIYQKIKDVNNLSDEKANRLLELELIAEEKVAIAREDVKKLFFELYDSKKKIVLVSDMYLSSQQIKQIIEKCGYPSEIEIFVSNEYGLSKSNSSLWRFLFEKYNGKRTLHFGDNKHSDYDTVTKLNHEAILISNPYEKFINSKIYHSISKFEDISFGNSLLLGKLCNSVLFNNAFSNEYNFEKVTGLWMGPALSEFIRWLITEKDQSLLLFVTREGYILQPAYLEYCKIANIEPQKNCLFYTSRRSASAASISNIEDFKDILKFPFEGSFAKFLETRCNFYGYDINFKKINVVLPKDKERCLELVMPFLDEIIKNSSVAKTNYIEYISQCLQVSKCSELTIVDIGYQGTTQYLLSKIINQKISGKYFLLSEKIFAKDFGCNCQSIIQLGDKVHHIYENINFFESSLQVPYGQTNSITKNDGSKISFTFGEPNQVSPIVKKAQNQFLQYVLDDALWHKLLGNSFKYSVDLIETIWIALIYYNYLPEDFICNLIIDDDFLGNNIWKYDSTSKSWKSDIGERKIYYHENQKFSSSKNQIKTFVKNHTPIFLYDTLKEFWIKYLK